MRDNLFFFYVAFYTSKLIKLILKLFRKKIYYYHGKIALKICPTFLKYISKPNQIIAVMGSNGKSTVCQLFKGFFKSVNTDAIYNGGYNSTWGIASMFINNLTLSGKVKTDICILEVDERNAPLVYEYVVPRYIVFTNLISESIKYNPNPYYVRDIIYSCISDKSKLVLNANDSIVSSLDKNNSIYYSMDKLKEDSNKPYNILCDVILCPQCGHELKYDYVKYYHIGSYICTNCDYKIPESNYVLSKMENKKVVINNYEYDYKFVTVENAYNYLAVVSTLRDMGYQYDVINKGLNDSNIIDRIYGKDFYKGKEIVKNLVKSHTSSSISSAFNNIRKDKRSKTVFLYLTSSQEYSLCEEYGFIYQVDFEFLCNANIDKLVIGGKRAKDIYLRALLSGFDKSKIVVLDTYDEIYKYADLNSEVFYFVYELYLIDLTNYTLVPKLKELL